MRTVKVYDCCCVGLGLEVRVLWRRAWVGRDERPKVIITGGTQKCYGTVRMSVKLAVSQSRFFL